MSSGAATAPSSPFPSSPLWGPSGLAQPWSSLGQLSVSCTVGFVIAPGPQGVTVSGFTTALDEGDDSGAHSLCL